MVNHVIRLLISVCVLMSAVVVFASDDEPEPTIEPESGRRAALRVETNELDCEVAWFFPIADLTVCPTDAPVETEATFQPFEYGYMLWLASADQIYVMHHSVGEPRWQAFDDPYVAGTPERDDDWPEQAPPQGVQPRYGFGVVWRENDALRTRIGWAAQTWETVYDTRYQSSEDGLLMIEEPGGGVFILPSEEESWQLYRDTQ